MTEVQQAAREEIEAEEVRSDDTGNAGIVSRQGKLPTFAGSKALYLKIAIFGSIGIHGYLFIGFYCIKNFVAGEPWPTHWLPIAGALASSILFALFAFRWIMRLDARYGKGSGWILEATSVKLPWQRHRD